jgi:hypothetical protein
MAEHYWISAVLTSYTRNDPKSSASLVANNSPKEARSKTLLISDNERFAVLYLLVYDFESELLREIKLLPHCALIFYSALPWDNFGEGLTALNCPSR